MLVPKLRGCARCGGVHYDLTFIEMKRPVSDPDGEFRHWATCPNTGDPILLATTVSKYAPVRFLRRLRYVFTG